MTIAGDDATTIAASLQAPALFADVFDRHWTAIRRFCTSRAGAAGEDLAAEAFRIAFDTRGSFDRRYPSAAPWLYGIATNLLRHWFRRQALERDVASHVDAEVDHDTTSELLHRVEAEQLGPELAVALADVPDVDRDALLLFAWADLTYPEIAAATGVPVGTVRSRIHRARVHVRAHLVHVPEDHR